MADKQINLASKSGSWVLLKNVHLAPRWLVQLEKVKSTFSSKAKQKKRVRARLTLSAEAAHADAAPGVPAVHDGGDPPAIARESSPPVQHLLLPAPAGRQGPPASPLSHTRRLMTVLPHGPDPDAQASLQHIFASIPPARMDRAPVERSRLYFLLAWFHVVVQERLRYIPLGWSKVRSPFSLHSPLSRLFDW